MDLVAVFTAALAAIGKFATSGVEEVGKQVVLDAYQALKKAIKDQREHSYRNQRFCFNYL